MTRDKNPAPLTHRPASPDRQPTPHRRGYPLGDDRGSTAVEIALAIPIGVALLLLLIAASRYASAMIEVQSTAGAAARAASLARSPGTASTAASRAAATLTDCTAHTVTVDTSAFRPGGQVTADVTCTISTKALTGFRIPGSITVKATSTSPLDMYRTVTTDPS